MGEKGLTPMESYEVADMLKTAVHVGNPTKEDHEEALGVTCRRLAIEAQKGLTMPRAEDAGQGIGALGPFYYAGDLLYPRRLVLTMFDCAWPKMMPAILYRCREAQGDTELLQLCFRCLEATLELATSFGVPSATRSAVNALTQVVASSKPGVLPADAVAKTEAMLMSGGPDTEESGAVPELLDVVDEEEDEREAERVLRQTGAVLAQDKQKRQPPPPQMLPQFRALAAATAQED